MDTFDHLLNWKLKVGSHQFPGPDGGTCINEAAVVAAGFPYKRIVMVEQMPKGFSRPICRFVMWLNDQADETERQRLLPYVTRLACADTREVEKARANYIRHHTRDYFALPFDRALEVLEGALAIGRQADLLGPDEVLPRMEAVRAGKARSRKLATRTTQTSAPDKPSSPKVETWLAMKETEPVA